MPVSRLELRGIPSRRRRVRNPYPMRVARRVKFVKLDNTPLFKMRMRGFDSKAGRCVKFFYPLDEGAHGL